MKFWKKSINFQILLIYSIIMYYKIFGLFPVTSKNLLPKLLTKKALFDLKFTKSTKDIIYAIFLSAYFILIIPFSLTSERYEEFSIVESSIKIMLLICENIGCTFVIFLYIYNQKLMMNTLNRFVQLENKLIENSDNLNDLKSNGRYFRIVIFITQMIITVMLLVTEVIGERYGAVYPFIRIIPKIFIASVIIQYTSLLIFIYRRFEYLNKSLVLLVNPSSNDWFSDFEIDITTNRSSCSDLIAPKLTFLRQAHRALYEITYNITEFYSWPILFAITGSCVRMILSLYYLIMVMVSVKAASLTRYTLAVLWVIIFVFPIIPLTGFVTNIITEIKKTGDVVNRVMDTYPVQMKVHYELQQFSVELLHRNLRFTACGLFSLDGSLVTSITSTMITYMIILVQFKDTILTSK